MVQENIDIRVRTQGVGAAQAGIAGIGGAATNASGPVGILTRNLAGLAAFAGFGVLTRNAIGFSTAMAEVSTIADSSTFNIRNLTDEVRSLSVEFGQSPTEQARALYQTISAGASSAADANTILRESSQLAVAGLTSTSVAVDAITSVLNSYNLEADNAGMISDVLFTVVRQGKTTVDELSSSIGRALPFAANAGVEFDELGASISTLTLAGLNTAESVTAMRAVFRSIIAPTNEAQRTLDDLGLNLQEIVEERGFGGLLEVLSTLDREQLLNIFTESEARAAILGLTQNLGVLNENLDGTANSLGATEEAAAIAANTVEHQFGRVIAGLNGEVSTGSEGIQNLLIPALRTLADNIGLVTDATIGFFGLWAANRVVAVVGNIGGITAAINALRRGVLALNVAAAANPVIALGAAAFYATAQTNRVDTERFNENFERLGLDTRINAGAEIPEALREDIRFLLQEAASIDAIPEGLRGRGTNAGRTTQRLEEITDALRTIAFGLNNPVRRGGGQGGRDGINLISDIPESETSGILTGDNNVVGGGALELRRAAIRRNAQLGILGFTPTVGEIDLLEGLSTDGNVIGRTATGAAIRNRAANQFDQNDIDEFQERLAETTDQFDRMGDVISNNVNSSINEFIRMGETDIPQFFRNLLADITSVIISSQTEFLGDAIGSGLRSAFTGIGGAQFGGTNIVTRRNSIPLQGLGADDRLFLIRAQLGEEFDARSDTNGRTRSGGVSIGNITINTDGQSADSFRRSIPQIRNELANQLTVAQARNA